jgi:hypothetical protein
MKLTPVNFLSVEYELVIGVNTFDLLLYNRNKSANSD